MPPVQASAHPSNGYATGRACAGESGPVGGQAAPAENQAEKMIPEFPSWLDPDRGVIKAVVEF